VGAATVAATETKRKYRRHPKPDENAPERPPSAYVIFSNKIREEVKDQNLSFTQIAKLVGDRWQKLDPVGKEPYEAQASAAKERYNIQLSAYKKTDAYKEYMQYLADFKAKHGGPVEPKRPKLDPESSGSILSVKSVEAASVEPPLPMPGHVRGGSMGSVSSSFTTTPMTSTAPLGGLSTRPRLTLSRSGSPPPPPPPPPQQLGRDQQHRPGFMSSHSSVSDESSTVRSDLPEPLLRTAALSLSTSASGTPPPLPPLVPPSGSSDPLGSPEVFSRSRLLYHGQPQGTSGPLSASTGPPSSTSQFPPTLPSPVIPDSAWRPRPGDVRGLQDAARTLLPSVPYAPSTPLTPSQLPPLKMSSDRFPDLGSSPNLRTLPLPRTSPTGVHGLHQLARAADRPRPATSEPADVRMSSREGLPSTLERSESDAANTLAGLASGVSRPESTRPPKLKRRPPWE